MPPFIVGSLLFGAGLVTGRALRPAAPPLIIQRSANSPLFNSDNAAGPGAPADVKAQPQPPAAEEVVYVCGARTKKGTPCSRRLHQPTRCWQHKGMPAMLPPEKLVVKG